MAVSVLGTAAGTLIVAGNPTDGGFGVCPFLAVTGHHCPGCGALRSVYSLLRGDLIAALTYNPLTLLVALPFVVWVTLSFMSPKITFPTVGLRTSISVLTITMLFGVLRNVPVEPFSYLAP